MTTDAFREPRDPLLVFIAARHAEDEAAATAATPGPWEFEGDDPTDDEVFTVHDGEHGDLVGESVAFTRGGGRQVANGAHIARNDPARALRRVEAGRALVAAYERSVRAVGPGLSQDLRRPLLAHAAIWDDHPDHDPAWT
jgi:Family of unknown function (DUF6221)